MKMGRGAQWVVVWVIIGVAIWSSLAADAASMDPNREHVRTQCGITRFPSLCVETLSGLMVSKNPDIVSALVNKSISEITKQIPNFYTYEKLAYHFISPQSQRARAATGDCGELMRMSLKRLKQVQLALREFPSEKNKHDDIQTWLSAALTFQQACKEAVDHAHAREGHGDVFLDRISHHMDYLSQLASNQLALVNHQITTATADATTTAVAVSKNGKNNNKNSTATSTTKSRGRGLTDVGGETEHVQELFPSWVSARNRKLLQTTTINADAIVAQDGSGDYMTVSEAIQAAYGSGFVIYVKAGVYKEKISANVNGLTLIGDGKYSTIIVGDDSVAAGSSLSGSATFTITGDGFIARDIGFQNTAGPQGEQAVALTVASDHSVLYKCSFVGYQDTLYALSLRQFYRECDIYGTIDFIFGNAAAVFQSCNLVFRKPNVGSAYNVILANGRTDPGENTGFSIQNCRITVASDFSPVKGSFNSYLGRPWKVYSRAAVMQSTIDDAISPRGWIEWPGTGSSYDSTLYFGEYANGGPGAGTSGRVQWPGFHVMTTGEAVQFTVSKLIAGTSWLPSTGVTFVSGL